MDHKVVAKKMSCKKWSQTACSEEREEEEKLRVPVTKQNKNEFKEPTTTHTNSRGGERRGGVCTWGRPAGDRTLKHSGQAGSKERASLFLVSKQNLNPFSWRIGHTNNSKKWII
jgi:hypothetical protein